MMIEQAYKKLFFLLLKIYDSREAANIADLVIEKVSGLRKVDRIINKQFILNNEHEKLLENYTNQLLQHKPVQYVLHETWFSGMKFYVDENVLIPRPETEELVEWIVNDVQCTICDTQNLQSTINNDPLTILDVGTGSGCIAIALKIKLKNTEVFAFDISLKALDVAKQNAENNNAEITFQQIDILNKNEWSEFPKFDIIVSNPPYVKQSESKTMHKNVIDYEPHEALFVEDKNPFIFYETIAEFGLQHLNKNGKLFFEINEAFGKDVCLMLEQFGYKNIGLKKDLQEKDRMIKAVLE